MSEDSKDDTKEEVTASEATPSSGKNADLKDRILGIIIDMVAVMVIYFVGGILVLVASKIASVLGLLISLVLFAIVLGYNLLRDALPFLDGQSIGKKMMGTRAVTEDGKPLTGNYGASALRNLLLFIWPVELIILAIRQGKPEEGRRLGDDVAKTRVVKI